MRKILVATLVAIAAPVSASAAPADVASAVAGRDRPEAAVALDGGRRPAEVLRFLGLERGDRALDMFTGTGYYAEIIARAIGPAGSATGWNPANFTTDAARKTWAGVRERAPNAAFFATPAPSLALPLKAYDFVMIHLDYHDVYWENEGANYRRVDPDAFVRTVFESVKPGGTVGVVDHVAPAGGDTREIVARLHRIDPDVVRADFERAGFVLEARSDLLRNPADDHSKSVFDPAIRGKTDRVIFRFRKPG